MEMRGERKIKASRETVWQALNDPEVLKACIPGCEELDQTSDTSFEGRVNQKIGPVKARFNVNVTLSDIEEAKSYRISGEGKGGAAGFAKGGAKVTLEDDGDGTLLTYDAEAKVGGKLAQLGSRLIDGYAKKMADQFFDRFKERVEPEGASSDEESGDGEDSGEGEEESDQGEAKRTEKAAKPEKSGGSDRGHTAGGGSAGAGSAEPSWLDRLKGWFRRLFG